MGMKIQTVKKNKLTMNIFVAACPAPTGATQSPTLTGEVRRRAILRPVKCDAEPYSDRNRYITNKFVANTMHLADGDKFNTVKPSPDRCNKMPFPNKRDAEPGPDKCDATTWCRSSRKGMARSP